MIALLRVEFTRLRWRRAVIVLVVTAVVVPVVLFVALAVNTRPPSDAAMASLTSNASFQRDVARCEKNPEFYGLSSSAGCTAQMAGYHGTNEPLDVANELHEGAVVQVVTIVAVLMLLAGATFAGADWNSGSMSNQLLFEPRRTRVWVAKAAAILVLSAVVAAVVLTGFWWGLYGLAHHRDLAPHPGLLRDGFEQVARSTALTAGLSLGGFALTMLLRSTVATLGVVFAVSAAGSIVIALVGGDAATPYQPGLNAAAVITDDVSYYVQGPCPGRHGRGLCSVEKHLHAEHGAIYTGGILVVLVGLSAVAFRRRDIA